VWAGFQASSFAFRKGGRPIIPFHKTHNLGACPTAEERCDKKELLVMSALDMDGLLPEAAYLIGQGIREELEVHPKNFYGIPG